MGRNLLHMGNRRGNRHRSLTKSPVGVTVRDDMHDTTSRGSPDVFLDLHMRLIDDDKRVRVHANVGPNDRLGLVHRPRIGHRAVRGLRDAHRPHVLNAARYAAGSRAQNGHDHRFRGTLRGHFDADRRVDA